MDNSIVQLERVLDAPVETVWKALTSKKEMDHWYFAIDAFEPVVGFRFQFTGQGSNGENWIHHCEITEVVPLKKLSYTWSYEGIKGLSEVRFELAPEGDQTKLRLTHTGIDSFQIDNPDFLPASFMQGWTHIIGQSLANYLQATTAAG